MCTWVYRSHCCELGTRSQFLTLLDGGREWGCWAAVPDTKTSPHDGDQGLQVSMDLEHDYISQTHQYTHIFEQRKDMIWNSENKKESNFHSVTHRDRGGIGTHIIRERGLSLWVWGPRSESNPYCICQFQNLINYHPQDSPLSTVGVVDNTMVLSTVGW